MGRGAVERGPSQRPEMAPKRYDQLAALAITQRVALEFEADTSDDGIRSSFINALTPAIEIGFSQVEPIERKRHAALLHIGENLKDRRLTAAEYRIAGNTLRDLSQTDKGLQALDLTAAQRYINDCADDAKYYEKHVASKEVAVVTKTSQVPEVVRDRRDERRRALQRRRYFAQLAGVNAKLLVVKTIAAASSVAFAGGFAGVFISGSLQDSLPAYSSPDTRHTISHDIYIAIMDLSPNGTSTTDALKSLQDADKNLKGAGTGITKPLETMEGAISRIPKSVTQGGDVFKPDRIILRSEMGKVRGLAQTPDAREYGVYDAIQTVSWGAIVGSMIIGGVDERSAEPLRREKRRLREKIENSY